jgi:uncharacterized protein
MNDRLERLWRRLDTPGHDACAIVRDGDGHVIDGMAVFRNSNGVARLRYRVDCDAKWVTRRALVDGWVGARRMDLRIARTEEGQWTLNGEIVAMVNGLRDVDLGFTPATNLLPIRRLRLHIGEEASAPAAWIDTADWRLKRLEQTYRRISMSIFEYRAPDQGYEGNLSIDEAGVVTHYPGLWEQVEARTVGASEQ